MDARFQRPGPVSHSRQDNAVLEAYKQKLIDMARGAALANTTGLLGMPADVGAMLSPALAMRQALTGETTPGGSEWMNQKLREAGLIDAPESQGAETMGGLLGGLLPTAKLAGLGKGLLAMGGIGAIKDVGKGMRAASNIKKGAIGDIFSNVDDPQQAMAMSLKGAHLKQDPAGQYIGAPRGVDSPGKLGAMRTKVDTKVAQGARGADWYDDTRAGISGISGYNTAMPLSSPEAAMAKLFARGGAAYSPQATPFVETNAFLKQHNAKMLTGENVAPRTKSQGNNVAAAYKLEPQTGTYDFSPGSIRLGKKTGPYSDAKDPTVDEGSLYKTANDIWHGRVFGYTNNDGSAFSRGFSPQEHGFLTGENLLMSDRANKAGLKVGDTDLPWTPRRGQAATWVAERFNSLKAENEAAIKAATKARAKWDKAPDSNKPSKSRPSIPKEIPEEDLWQKAMISVDDAVNHHVAYATQEFTPGLKTGHLTKIAKDPTLNAEYSAARMAAAGERDPFYQALQMYQKEVLPAQGSYVNSAGISESNPMYSRRPLVDLQNSFLGANSKGDMVRGGQEVSPVSRDALDTVEFLRGGLDGQEAVSWNKLIPANSSMKASEKSGARIVPVDAAQREGLLGALNEKGLESVDVGDAIHAGLFEIPGVARDGQAIQKSISSLANEFPGVDITRGRWNTSYQELPWGAEGSGQVTRAMVDRINNSPIPNLAQRLDAGGTNAYASSANTIDRAFGQANQTPVREDLMHLRDIIGQPGGWQNLLKYVREKGYGGLPAVVGTAGLFGLPSDDQY